MKEEIHFLVMLIDKNGIAGSYRRVTALQTWPKPRWATGVRRFLGMLQSFRKFIKSFAKIATPPTDLMRKGAGAPKWNDICDKGFGSLKPAVSLTAVLVSPD